MDSHAALNASKGEACGFVLLVFEYGHTAVLQEKQSRRLHRTPQFD